MKVKKCIKCKKRQLTNMVCSKCGKTVCITHRFTEDHDCNYNYSIEGKKQLEKENVKIVAKKIESI